MTNRLDQGKTIEERWKDSLRTSLMTALPRSTSASNSNKRMLLVKIKLYSYMKVKRLVAVIMVVLTFKILFAYLKVLLMSYSSQTVPLLKSL